jgi:hypothetical protein
MNAVCQPIAAGRRAIVCALRALGFLRLRLNGKRQASSRTCSQPGVAYKKSCSTSILIDAAASRVRGILTDVATWPAGGSGWRCAPPLNRNVDLPGLPAGIRLP